MVCALNKEQTLIRITSININSLEIKAKMIRNHKQRDRRNSRDKMFLTGYRGEKKNELQNSSPCYLQTRTKEAENRSNDSCSLIDRRLA